MYHVLDCFSTICVRLGLKWAAELWKGWCELHLLRFTIPNCVSVGVAFLRELQGEALLPVNMKWELISLLHTRPALTSGCTFKYVNCVWPTWCLCLVVWLIRAYYSHLLTLYVCRAQCLKEFQDLWLLIKDSFQKRSVELLPNWCLVMILILDQNVRLNRNLQEIVFFHHIHLKWILF